MSDPVNLLNESMDTEETVESESRQLLRPVKGRWIAGVAAGVSRRFRIPVWIVRILLVLLTLPLSYYPLFELIDNVDDRLSWLALPALLAMQPFGIILPVGWGMVLYLMGWIMIPREDAEFLGYEKRMALLPYPGRAGIYLAASLIASWAGSQYYATRYSEVPYDLILLFTVVFWPSLLVLAAARFRALGTVISAITGCGLVVLSWVLYANAEDSTSLMGLLIVNTVTTPPALLVIWLAEWQRRRRILRTHNHRETATDSNGGVLEDS